VAYWWVNQGKTYQAERSAGILWAPQQTARGRALGHWSAMKDVRSGDLVLHYARGAVRALGRANAPATHADRPYGLPEVWESPGWMVPVRYYDLPEPIGRDEIPMNWRLAEAPFDRHGDVKQGYLYPLSDASVAELLDQFGNRWPSEALSDETTLSEQLLEAITALRRWTRDDIVAVHKPLLLLIAFDRIRRGEPRLVSFVELEPQLRALITEFSATQGPSHPEYPFWRLQADGLWEVPEAAGLPSRASNTDPPVSVLRERRIHAGLPVRFYELLLARGDVLDQAVSATLQHSPVELRPRVLERLGWDDIPTRMTPQQPGRPAALGVPYRDGNVAIPRPAGAPYRPDPDKVGRGVEAHTRTLRALVSAVRARGIEPLLPGDEGPLYDLAWETETTIFVAEVKSLTLANEERQLRLGLGQVLRYWHALSHGTKPVIAILAVEQKPADETWLTLCDRLGVRLFWLDSMAAAVAELP
jgi:hypothetical protein